MRLDASNCLLRETELHVVEGCGCGHVGKLKCCSAFRFCSLVGSDIIYARPLQLRHLERPLHLLLCTFARTFLLLLGKAVTTVVVATLEVDIDLTSTDSLFANWAVVVKKVGRRIIELCVLQHLQIAEPLSSVPWFLEVTTQTPKLTTF